MPRYDLGVFSKDRQLVLVVEIVGGQDTSAGNAARYRKNLLSTHALPESPFLLLAYKKDLYLWKRETEESQPSDYRADIKPILSYYLGPVSNNESVSERGESLEIAIKAWLKEVAYGLRTDETKADLMLRDSGVTALIRGGEVRTEVT